MFPADNVTVVKGILGSGFARLYLAKCVSQPGNTVRAALWKNVGAADYGKPGCQAYTLPRNLDPRGRNLIPFSALLKVGKQFGELLVQ